MMMMDNNTNTPSTSPQDQISLLFAAAQETQTQQQLQMHHHHHHHHHPFSSSSSSYYHYPFERGSGGEDSGAGTGSEEGLDVPEEEPARPAPHRSGSKRSRAAEVHNLSEKRRRSRINEKMKALQNLIPNSNKRTDKASMLDEAIEYLQQLQLQVQMLSMRNGLNTHPMCLPGARHPLQNSKLCMSFGDNAPAMNMGVLGMLPLNQDSSANNSFDLTSQCTTSHQRVMLPTASISAPETTFSLEPLQSHHAAFQLQVPSEEMFTQDMVVSQQQLDSGRTTGDLSENVMKTMDVPTSLHYGGQASSSLEQNDHMENVLSMDNPDKNPIFDQNFDGLQTGRSFSKDDVKSEALGI